MNKKITIKDIYVGRPDAKDEINFDGMGGFVESFVLPEAFNMDNLLNGCPCFITGYKGTGKTALLFYLEHLFEQQDPSSCASFIFFKEEYTEVLKKELESVSKRILSSIVMGDDTMLDNTNFEYIWQWLFFKRIVADNDNFNGGLFVEDEYWNQFVNIIGGIKAPSDNKKVIIPPKIKFALPIKDCVSQVEYGPELEIDFHKKEQAENYSTFIDALNKAEKALSKTTRTDIPYHIFVDELEAYCGNEDVFKRDLYFIRDLLFTVKKFNQYFADDPNTKIYCSVRLEIINAISRFIITKELNKVTNGFEIPLNWNYSNTSSYMHPIIKVLLKRIAMGENLTLETSELTDTQYKEIYERWFPEKIQGIEPANYILNNGWNKPRDIVRLIYSAQNSIKADATGFSQSVFDAIRKKYSLESLSEIKEELRALYSSEDIEIIINCFTGYKTMFSLAKLRERIQDLFPDTILHRHLNRVLTDLYRLGFIGNYLPVSDTYRWQHRGDEGIILSDEWRIMLHHALHGALSVGIKQDIGIKRTESLEIGDVVNVFITKIYPKVALVEINLYGKKLAGSIHISQICDEFVHNIEDKLTIGEEYRAMVIGYDTYHKCWKLTLKLSDSADEYL